jgi:hypothetical protein
MACLTDLKGRSMTEGLLEKQRQFVVRELFYEVAGLLEHD